MTRSEQEQFVMEAMDDQLEEFKNSDREEKDIVHYMNGYLQAALILGFMAGDEFNHYMNVLSKRIGDICESRANTANPKG